MTDILTCKLRLTSVSNETKKIDALCLHCNKAEISRSLSNFLFDKRIFFCLYSIFIINILLHISVTKKCKNEEFNLFDLSCLHILGISGVFGFLIFGTNEASVVFAHIFAVLTSLQGNKSCFKLKILKRYSKIKI